MVEEINKKTEELYQEYLKGKLDLIFYDAENKKAFDIENTSNDSKNSKISDNNTIVVSDHYDTVWDFVNGYAKVKKGDKYNFINNQGQLIGKWHDAASDFVDGYAIIADKFWPDSFVYRVGHETTTYYLMYNFMDTKGKLICNIHYDGVWDFHNGYAKVKKDNKYNFIDTTGKLISEAWYDDVWSFEEGYAVVEKDSQYNFIDTKGRLISDDWYDFVEDFSNGYAKIRKSNKYNYIDVKGKTFGKWSREELKVVYRANVTKFIKNGVFNQSDTKDYEVKKNIFGYVCKNSFDKFMIKYRPVKMYGFRYILCYSKNVGVMLYDRINSSYEKMIVDAYYDNLIITSDKVYLIYDDRKIDITDYYNKYLNGKKVKVNEGIDISDVLDESKFYLLNREDIKELVKEEIRKNEEEKKRIEEQQEKERIKNELKKKKEEEEKIKAENLRKQQEALAKIEESFKQLQELEGKIGKIARISVDNIFIKVDGHLEIVPSLIEHLKYIDLGNVFFRNVKVSGIDFRKCNIALYPQDVYQKDLSGCNFEGLHIPPFMNFMGVDIRGTKFSEDDDSKTIDGQNQTFKDAIYDETTTYNGKSFIEIYGPCKRKPKR